MISAPTIGYSARKFLLPAWCGFSVSVGAFAATVTSLGIAAALAAALVLPALILLLARAWSYERLMLITIIMMSNLFLIHKVIAIHTSNGDNLFGIRDVLLIAVIIGGVYKGRDRLLLVASHPLIWPGIVVVLLLPSAFLLGLINGARFVAAAREMYTLGMWILPLVVAANIRSRKYLLLLYKTFVVLGVVVAVGVILEVGSFGALQLVSTIRVLTASQILTRVFPDAWVFMTFACVSSVVGILGKRNLLQNALLYVVTMTGMILTLQRGMPAATICGTFLLVLLVGISRNRDLLARRAAIPLVSTFLIVAAVAFVANQISPYVRDWLSSRITNAFEDLSGRQYELQKVGEVLGSHPFIGLGLGARYRDPLPETFIYDAPAEADDGTFCHNYEGFAFVKLGIAGPLAFLAFAAAIVIRLWRYCFRTTDPEARNFGLVICASFIIWIVIAQTDNVFGDIRTLPICAVAAAMLTAHELIQRSEAGPQNQVFA